MRTVDEGWGVDIGDAFVVSAACDNTELPVPPAPVVRVAANRPRLRVGAEALADRAGSGVFEPGVGTWLPREQEDLPYHPRLAAHTLWQAVQATEDQILVKVPGRGRPLRVAPSKALAALAHKAVPSQGTLAVAIPDHWDEAPQDRLLNALRRRQGAVHLLWRPVAAALGLREHWPDVRRLVVLDVGGSHPELTVLKLARRDGCLVPVRSRPGRHPPFPPPLSAAMHAIGRQLLRGVAASPTALWNLWYGQGWLPPAIAGALRGNTTEALVLASSPFGEVFARVQLGPGQLREGFQEFASRDSHLTGLDGTQQRIIGLYAWVREAASMLVCPEQPFATAIVGWPAAIADAHIRLQDALLRGAPWLAQGKFLTTTPATRISAVAQGAALFAQYRTRGLPTYYDTLPRLQLHVAEGWHTSYLDVIPDNTLIEASQVFGRTLTGLALGGDSRRLCLRVRRNDHDLPRQAVIELPQAPESTVPLLLAAEYRAASGHAQVEVKSADPTLSLSRRKIRVHWDEMAPHQLPVAHKKVRAWLPVAPTEQGPRSQLRALVAQLRELAGASRYLPRDACHELRQKLGNSPGLVSSSGLPPGMVDDAARRGVERIAREVERRGDPDWLLITRRLYVDVPGWYQRYAVARIGLGKDWLMAAGCCVGEEEPLRALLQKLCARFLKLHGVVAQGVPDALRQPSAWLRWETELPTRDRLVQRLDELQPMYWFWCAARLFRFRDKIAELVSLHAAETMANFLGEYLALTVARGRHRRERESTRREALRFLLFLLRMREKTRFLDPESELAQGLKRVARLHKGINAGGEYVSQLIPQLIDVSFPESHLPRLLKNLSKEA